MRFAKAVLTALLTCLLLASCAAPTEQLPTPSKPQTETTSAAEEATTTPLAETENTQSDTSATPTSEATSPEEGSRSADLVQQPTDPTSDAAPQPTAPAPTESAQQPTESPTVLPTEPPAVPPTDPEPVPVTEAPTEPPTEPPTQPPAWSISSQQLAEIEAYGNAYAQSLGATIDYSMTTGNSGYLPPDTVFDASQMGMDGYKRIAANCVQATYDNLSWALNGNMEGLRMRVLVVMNASDPNYPYRMDIYVLYG